MKRMILMLALAAGALTACGDNSGVTGQGRLRIVHLSPDGPPVDATLDGDTLLTNLAYLGSSDYLDLSEAGHTLQISAFETGATLIDTDVTIADATDYTLLAADSLRKIRPILLTDDNSPPPAGKIRVRAVQGAPSAPTGVDIYVTQPGTDLTNETPAATNVKFGAVSPYVDADAGTYEVRVTPTGSTEVLIDGTLTLESGQVRTAIAVDAAAGGGALDLLVLDDRD
jgi:uncharacterized protein DUF4397